MRKKKKLLIFTLSLLLPSFIILLLNLVFCNMLSYSPVSSASTSGYYIFPFLVAFASFWTIKTPRYGKIHIIIPVFYGMLLSYGSPFAVFTLCGVVFLNTLLRLRSPKRMHPIIIRENLVLVLSLLVPSLVYRLLVNFSFGITLDRFFYIFAAFVFVILIESLIIHFADVSGRVVYEGLDRRYFMKFNSVLFKVSLFTTVPLSLLIALLTVMDSRALILLAPVYVMYKSMKNYTDISNEVKKAIEDLAISYEKRTPYGRRHSINVARISELIARELLLSDEETEKIVSAAKVHDIGNIGVADSILENARYGGLTEIEFEAIKKHPETGLKVTNNLSWYKSESKMVYHHHERFDGTGYPSGLKGDEIPLGARILAVAEAYDAMASPRAYRDSLSEEFIEEELYQKKGTQFDPKVVDALLTILSEKKSKLGNHS